MTVDRSLTASSLERLGDEDILIRHFLQRRLAATMEDFLEALHDDVVAIVSMLEENPHQYSDDTEDQTTQRLVDMLKCMGYTAHHNAQAGGNVDLTVEITRKNFRWIAEAKKFGDVGDLREGYLQLATRYKPGVAADGVAHGGLLAYLRRPDAKGKMEAWKAHFLTLPIAAASKTKSCKRRGKLGFISEHPHADYGIPLRVWHVCVMLNFEPKDASARSAKRYS